MGVGSWGWKEKQWQGGERSMRSALSAGDAEAVGAEVQRSRGAEEVEDLMKRRGVRLDRVQRWHPQVSSRPHRQKGP